MRKNWTKNEDLMLSKIVTDVGMNDWTAVATLLKQRYEQFDRTGKQCRQRWYNHLDPKVNKEVWAYEEELLLFEMHKELGNRWKQISLRLKGRTDNNIKNHFYSTLRRSLRRLNKVIGQKNSTLHMREIKPSVLTIILNFIYDHQEENAPASSELVQDLKDLPKLIFEFAEFKPVKGNMAESQKEEKKKQIETIFNLVEQFKDSYYQEKHQKVKIEPEESQEQARLDLSPLAHPIITSQFKPLNKHVNIIVNLKEDKSEDSAVNMSSKYDSGEKQRTSATQRFLSDNFQNMNMIDLEEPSPITSINMEKGSFMDLVVVGHHWSPKREPVETADRPDEVDIDEILEINYE